MDRPDLERALATRLSPVSRAWRQLADETLARLGVSNSTGWCLVYMQRLGADARQADLARAIGIREASLVPTLNRLEASKLVERRPDPRDRRANNLLLTEAGRALALEIEAELTGLRADLLAGLPSGDIEAALRVCDTLDRHISERRTVT